MARRANGEGCVTKCASGKWSARVQIGFKPNGKPRIKTFSANTRREATERLNNYLASIDAEHHASKDSVTVADGMLFWLETYKKIYLKPTSYDRLETTINSNIIPYIGYMHVSDLAASVIQGRLINTLYAKGLSYPSIKKAYHALNGYLKQCLCDDIITKNPMLGVRLPSQNQFAKKEVDILTPDERNRFRTEASKRFASTNGLITRNGYAYIMMLYTGLRLSEALALKWDCVDFDKACLYISGNVVSAKDRSADAKSAYKVLKQGSTKTEAGMRTVPLCNMAMEALRMHRDIYALSGSDYVFTSRNGNLVSPRNFAKSLNGIYRRAGIVKSGAHILRHTFASMLFQKGVDIKIISKILGHSRVEVTYNIYVHLIKDQESEAVYLLDDII